MISDLILPTVEKLQLWYQGHITLQIEDGYYVYLACCRRGEGSDIGGSSKLEKPARPLSVEILYFIKNLNLLEKQTLERNPAL